MKNRYLGLLLVVFFAGSTHCFSLSVELRRTLDNSPINALRFTPAQKSAIYTQAEAYIRIEYADPSELANLKIYSNNPNWNVGSTPRDGLVNNPPNRRVPVYYFVQTGIQNTVMNAQNEAQWKMVQDINPVGFNGLDPSRSAIPAFPSGVTYLYLAAKMNSTTATLFYTTGLTVSNIGEPGSGNSGPTQGKNGFGSFHGIFKPNEKPTIDFPFEIASDGKIDIEIYDRQGYKIKQLISGSFIAGLHTASWDGFADDGTPTPSGLYAVTLKTSGDKIVDKAKFVVVR